MSKAKVDVLDKPQREDHDTLIRVESKVDNLASDFKDFKDGQALTLGKHEARIEAIEKVHEETNPKQAIIRLDEVYQWKHDFQLTWKTVIGIAGTMGGITGFLLALFTLVFRIIR